MCNIHMKAEPESNTTGKQLISIPTNLKEVNQMLVKCAWCGCEMGIVKGNGITHGICRSCEYSLIDETLKYQSRKEPKKWQN